MIHRIRRMIRREWPGLVLLLAALAFNAVALFPETRIGRVPVNDATLHLALAERLGQALAAGEPLLDPWVSEWSLGYPVWRSYQPLPHLLAAAVLALSPADHAVTFAWLGYLLIALLPASLYGGARLLGLAPLAAGLAAALALAPSGSGELGRYGLGYGATVWRGSGLFTQLVALHFLAWTLGAVARALDRRRRRPLAALLLALTALSHVIFGYVALASAALFALVGPRGERSRRLVALAQVVLAAACLLLWFVVPLLLARGEINHSQWEKPEKWDSFGAPFVLSALVSGELLDAERAPVLGALVALGALGALTSLARPLARRLLALGGLWLALFFGRDTWGHLLRLAFVPADLHLHRLQGAFELSAVLLAGFGLVAAAEALGRRRRLLLAPVALALAAALAFLAIDRWSYLDESTEWGEASLEAYAREQGDLDAALADVGAILAERPGRVSAGLAATWGGKFQVGSAAVYSFLSRGHLDQASFLYHAMSRTSEVMVLRDENDPVHDVVFAIRAVLAPADRAMPVWLRRRALHGRFAVYEASHEGYFGLVDIAGRYTGADATEHEPSTAWLRGPLPRAGVTVALDADAPYGPAFGRWELLPPAPAWTQAAAGRVLTESKDGETYRARVALERPAHVLVKITWSADLVATVDGEPETAFKVAPGFVALPAPAGEHDVEIAYRPGPLKPLLLVAGILLFALAALAPVPASIPRIEARAGAVLAELAGRRLQARALATVALAVLCLLALRPLLRGRLVMGHDAANYPPRLEQMRRALADGHLPPLWAPDLGSGHGQPLFEFAPPLVYAAAVPLREAGLGIADSLQIALALLHALGAAAVYRLGRRAGASRPAAVAAAALWLFSPYTSLDLFVRAAFAEAAAVACAPVALLGLLAASDRPSLGRVALGGAAIALVPLAHNATALLLVPALALILVASAAASAAGKGVGQGARAGLRRLGGGALALTSGLCLSAFFWLPALLEKEFVKTHLLRQDFLHWRLHILSPVQLLWSRWQHGLSLPGPEDGMSFALGPVHLALALAGLGLSLVRSRRHPRAEAAAYAFAALAGAVLATTWSAPLWQRLETLQYLVYPWRTLFLPGLLLPLLAVPALEAARGSWPLVRALERLRPGRGGAARLGRWPQARLEVLGAKLGRAAVPALVAIVVLVNLGHTEPQGYLRFDDEFYAPLGIAERGQNTTTREEYEPRWVEARPPYRAERLVGLDTPVTSQDIEIRTARRELAVSALAAGPVEATLFYYPGWKVLVDGQAVPIWPWPERGTIGFALPAGEHRVTFVLEPTAIRRLGLALSAGTLLALAAGLALTPRRPAAPRAAASDPPGGAGR